MHHSQFLSRAIGLLLQEQWIAEPRNFLSKIVDKVGGRRLSLRDAFEKRVGRSEAGNSGSVA